MLHNDLLRNTTLSTDYGVKEVDEIGVVKGLTQAQEKEIGKLHGFTYNEDKKQSQKQPKKSETDSKDNKETKTESKNESKKQSTKTQQNKTTTTKTTANKTTKTTDTKQSK